MYLIRNACQRGKSIKIKLKKKKKKTKLNLAEENVSLP